MILCRLCWTPTDHLYLQATVCVCSQDSRRGLFQYSSESKLSPLTVTFITPSFKSSYISVTDSLSAPLKSAQHDGKFHLKQHDLPKFSLANVDVSPKDLDAAETSK